MNSTVSTQEGSAFYMVVVKARPSIEIGQSGVLIVMAQGIY